MIVIVAYDISREEVRGVLRRYLAKMDFSIIDRSVNAGVGGRKPAERVAERAKGVVEPGDHRLFIIVVKENEYFGALTVTSMGVGTVGGRGYELP